MKTKFKLEYVKKKTKFYSNIQVKKSDLLGNVVLRRKGWMLWTPVS